ncbi:hypothetical protein, partial [Mammaliicoccus fleurettii]|uniref:hypothetical protein n=1 Tax=Mammaliicoccus fleurettii TaxID=150056 RepID=UPI001EE444B6
RRRIYKSWTDENEPITNIEPTSYEELELAFAKLQKKYEENNELLLMNNRKLDRLEETMNNTLKEEQTTNKKYSSKT